MEESPLEIEPYAPAHLAALIDLTLRAWTPVFASIEAAMGSDIFRAQHPDWRVDQQAAVESVCADPDVPVWVAIEAGRPVGFVAAQLHHEDAMGEITILGVDPEAQQRGIGSALTRHALAWLREAGMTTAMVETGADPGHAPARRTYAAAGFRLVPVARYFKML